MERPRYWTNVALVACTAGCAAAQQTPTPPPAPSFAALERAIAAGEFPKLSGVIVERHGSILFERYTEISGPDALANTRSVGKSLTALVVGAAIAEGKIAGLDEGAFTRFKDLEPFASDGPPKRAITVRDL